MNDDKVFRLLMETNPVPDPDGLDSPLALTELERRSPIMTTPQPNSGKRNNGLLIGAIAAVAVLIVGLGSWAALADNPSGPSTTAVAAASSTTTPPADSEAFALATVSGYLDALNRGDIPAMLEMVTGAFASDIGDGTFEAILAAANHHGDIIEPCRVIAVTVDQFGFPMDPDSPETAVECTSDYYNDFFGPAGIFVEPRVERFYVTPDAKIVGFSNDLGFAPPETDPANIYTYTRAFYDWLALAYPDVYEEIKVEDGDSIPGWYAKDPGHMTIAIQYVEEFVAQSDVYPIEPDGN